MSAVEAPVTQHACGRSVPGSTAGYPCLSSLLIRADRARTPSPAAPSPQPGLFPLSGTRLSSACPTIRARSDCAAAGGGQSAAAWRIADTPRGCAPRASWLEGNGLAQWATALDAIAGCGDRPALNPTQEAV